MNWRSPEYLWLGLSAVPVLLALFLGERRRRRDLAALTGPRSCAGASMNPSPLGETASVNSPSPLGERVGVRGILKPELQRSVARPLRLAPLLPLLLWVTALAGPQWGTLAEKRSTRGGDIMVALDVSKSMLAEDMGVSRLAAAKKSVASLAGALQGDRIGLIAFAGSAFVVCPLTNDYAAFDAALSETGVDTIPLGGSSLAAGLNEAKRAFAGTKGEGRTLLLLGDGEDHGSGYRAAAQALAAEGITVHAVAVGTAQGELIPLPQGGFRKDATGAVIKSRLNREALGEIAEAGGGRLVDLAASPESLVELYRQELPAREGRVSEGSRQRLRERFQIPLALGLVFLLLGPLLSLRRSR